MNRYELGALLLANSVANLKRSSSSFDLQEICVDLQTPPIQKTHRIPETYLAILFSIPEMHFNARQCIVPDYSSSATGNNACVKGLQVLHLNAYQCIVQDYSRVWLRKQFQVSRGTRSFQQKQSIMWSTATSQLQACCCY